jgi:thioredoxin-like negative regulator of GroEL
MSATPPDALLFVAPGCPHCATVLQGLNELVKQSLVGKITVVNVADHPEQAAEYGVRAAPWLRLGPFTLIGAQSTAELRQWAEWASGEEGVVQYIKHLLKQGGYQQAAAFIAADTQRLKPLLSILVDPDANIGVRLGVSALLESYADKTELQNLLPQLAELARHSKDHVRADACYLLGLTGSAAARVCLEECIKDENEEVREIAEEAMDRLENKR